MAGVGLRPPVAVDGHHDHAPGGAERQRALFRAAADQGRAQETWQIGALIALALGLAAVALQIYQLLNLPFPPGSSGYSSVFTGFYPVFLFIQLAVLIWLEMLLARSRYIPALSFVEQPPTYTETYLVQRFQASLSAFSTVWSYMAVMALLFWLLFYAL